MRRHIGIIACFGDSVTRKKADFGEGGDFFGNRLVGGKLLRLKSGLEGKGRKQPEFWPKLLRLAKRIVLSYGGFLHAHLSCDPRAQLGVALVSDDQ
jgi:hypothetical protein